MTGEQAEALGAAIGWWVLSLALASSVYWLGAPSWVAVLVWWVNLQYCIRVGE